MKSHVSMEQHQCFVCGTLYDTGNILLDKRLQQSMERHTVTGTGLCPEHQKLKEDGYIALIVMDDKKNRTGDYVCMRKEMYEAMFNLPVLEKNIAYIDLEVFYAIAAVAKQRTT